MADASGGPSVRDLVLDVLTTTYLSEAQMVDALRNVIRRTGRGDLDVPTEPWSVKAQNDSIEDSSGRPLTEWEAIAPGVLMAARLHRCEVPSVWVERCVVLMAELREREAWRCPGDPVECGPGAALGNVEARQCSLCLHPDVPDRAPCYNADCPLGAR